MISDEARERIDREIAKYPAPRGALLFALHVVQDEHGCIDAEATAAVAELFGMRPVEVMEVVSFYNMFRTRPGARHHAYVCTNLPCALRGSRALLARLAAHLGVDEHGDTPDGRIHLGHEECLGACAWAPMMRVDGVYHEDLDFSDARSVLDGLD